MRLRGLVLVCLVAVGLLMAQQALSGIPAVTHASIAVATTSTAVVALNNTRTFLLLQNISDTAMDCKIGAAAVANQGIRIFANGNLFMDSTYPVGAVNCIHAGTGTKTLLVTEGTQ